MSSIINIKFSKLKEYVIVIFFLSTITFFLTFGETIEKLLTYISFFLLIILYVKNKTFTIPREGLLFISFLFSVLLSIIPAKLYWNQAFMVSIVAILPFLIYGFYIILIGLGVDKNFLVNVICFLGKLYAVLYIIKFFIPSVPIGSIVVDGVRGDRMIIPGEFFNYFLFFVYLYKYLNKSTKCLIIWLVISLIVIVLPMTRQRIVMVLLLSAIMVIRTVNIKKLKRMLPIFIIVGGLVTGPIILKLSQITNEQMTSENPYDHIRELGMIYYFTEFPHKGINYLIGNGIPSYGRSVYGDNSKEFAESTKIFLIDIGFAGIYNYFGFIGLGLYIYICLRFAFKKGKNKYPYCQYFLLLILGSSVLSGVPLIPSQFMFIGICAYLLTPHKDGCKYNHHKLQHSSVSN